MATQQIAEFLYSTSNFLALPFEKNFDANAPVEFAKANFFLPIAIVTAYLIFCRYGSDYMKDLKPFNLQLPLAGWNAALCLFSFIGMCRTVSINILL